MDLLRFMTAGSVDDGKSTLIGRLLYECSGVYEDQARAVERASIGRNAGPIDFSLFTDGLGAEREQGITIDVAFRYFSTSRRRFVLADAPGHEQYTRNMASAASIADLAVLLVDATKGVLPQSTRHARIATLMGIRQFVLAVNKMDLVGYREEAFRRCVDGSAQLGLPNSVAIPVSALCGDNVARASSRTPWYSGKSLLDALESAPVSRNDSAAPLRFPIQSVLRPADGGRLYAGRILSGNVYPGQEVVVFPGGRRTRVLEPEGAQGASLAIRLADELDLSRGHMIASVTQPPAVGGTLRATLLWLSEQSLEPSRRYLLKHTTQYVYAEVKPVNGPLKMNDISQAAIASFRPLFFDRYRENRHTGSFILIDPASSETVAAGLIDEPMPSAPIRAHGLTVWFTGLCGAGKSTIASEVFRRLRTAGIRAEWLDGDEVRKELTHDLGFSRADRAENAARIAYVANLLTRQDVVVLVSILSPFRKARQAARARIGSYIEVFVNAPLEICEQRDPKGLYRKARAGEIKGFTGIDDPYEPPLAPEVECRTDQESLEASVTKVLDAMRALGYILPQD